MISNLELRNAYPGTHATSNASFLSAAKAKRTESTDYHLGTTVDQIAAQQIGQDTQLPSLELSMDLLSVVGQCDNGYACVYQNNLSWSSPTTPLPAEAHPRIVFENLFGEEGTAADRRAALKQRASLLDSVTRGTDPPAEDARAGRSRLASTSIWSRFATSNGAFSRPKRLPSDNPLPDLDRPIGVPASYADHARLMFDLQVLALQGDITRVITFQLARETSNRTLSGDRRLRAASSADAPRQRSGKDRQGGQDQSIPRLAVRRVPAEAARPRPRGTARCSITCSICTAAAWAIRTSTTTSTCRSSSPAARPGNMRGGRHIRYDEPTPLANLHLTLLDKVGVRLDSFADSDGKMDELFQPLSL